MKLKFVIYVFIAIGLQILLGQVTGKGQGGIAMLLFIVIVEIDPEFSFSYLISKNKQQ